jgi:hypothetical protein
VEQSILTSTKKMLGIDASYTVFDLDILTHINSAFATLNQLGIGPESGFMITDATSTWDSVIGTEPRLQSVKTYVWLKVRNSFDPPSTSYQIQAFEKQIQELEWRLNVFMEGTIWVDPNFGDSLTPDLILDGGAP